MNNLNYLKTFIQFQHALGNITEYDYQQLTLVAEEYERLLKEKHENK
jgi:hypothetical protein